MRPERWESQGGTATAGPTSRAPTPSGLAVSSFLIPDPSEDVGFPHSLVHWYLHKTSERKSFQGKALSSNSAQMNWVSHDNIIIFSDGYHAVFSGFFFG